MRFNFAALYSIFLLLSPLSLALEKANAVNEESATSKAEKLEAQLRLKPKLCIVRRSGGQCNTEVDVRWNASAQSTFCLYRAGSSEALQCWRDSELGEFVDQLSASSDTHYWLQWELEGLDPNLDVDLENQEAARAILKVVSVVPEDRRRSRRRRHIWSVF